MSGREIQRKKIEMLGADLDKLRPITDSLSEELPCFKARRSRQNFIMSRTTIVGSNEMTAALL
jgi:hypothetical protein